MRTGYKYGEKHVYYNGSIFCGTNYFHTIVSIYGLLQPFVVYLFFQYHEYSSNSFNALQIILLITLQALTLFLFIVTALIDPGFLGRKANEPPKDESDVEIIEYKDRNFKSNYCPTCKFQRPLRCHHCRSCGVCIEEMDHHCPWVGNCIGKRNRGIFLWFLICTLGLSIWELLLSLDNINWNSNSNWEAIKSMISIYEVVHTGLISIFCFALLVVQIIVISRGVTTVEHIKQYWKGIANPFDEGCLSNWKSFFWTDRSAKKISIDDIRFLHEEKNKGETDQSKTRIDSGDLHYSLEMGQHQESLLHS